MTTSGVTIKELTRDELINAALRKIGVLGEGQTANSAQLDTGAEALNAALIELQVLGLPLWKRTELTIPMVSGQSTYTIGVGQSINVPFPLKLQEAIFQMSGANSKIDVNILANYDWNLLPSNSGGIPVNITYQPFINYGVVRVWPTPNSSTIGDLLLIYQEPVDVTTTGTETIDYPQEWQNAIIYYLAYLLADEYQLPIQDRQLLEKKADKHVGLAASFGAEEASITLFPDRKGQ